MADGMGKAQLKRFIKRLLFMVSLALLTTMGVNSFVVGVWLILDRTDFQDLIPSSFSVASTAAMCCTAGVAVCVVSVVGWISVKTYNRSLLNTFAAFAFLLIVVQVSTCILGIAYKYSTHDRVRRDLLTNINRTTLVTGEHAYDLSVSWDRIQKSLECCGVDHEYDWYYSVRWPSKRFVPDSCCNSSLFSDVDSMNNCGKLDNREILFHNGCFEVFADWLYHHVSVMTWASFSLLIIEVICFLIAVDLYKSKSFFALSSRESASYDDYQRCLMEMSVIDGGYPLHSESMESFISTGRDALNSSY